MLNRNKTSSGRHEKQVDLDLFAKALAKAVYEGDIVNFRHLFQPFSPARQDSPERFETDKSAYLLPDEAMEAQPGFKDCLADVRCAETWNHICKEIAANRPVQLPWHLLMRLADNAVRADKHTSAAQAYELLRVRPRMQDEFFRQADAALKAGEVACAVRGYIIATNLAYNYAAFPEPLPTVPDFQTRALMLHGDYPDNPDDAVGMQEPETFMHTALSYLLLDAKAAARLNGRPVPVRLAFLNALVVSRDPDWPDLARRYREAETMAARFGPARPAGPDSLAREIEEQSGDDPRGIPAHLLGWSIENGEWWQYLKELAYRHPAAVLFVARQAVGDCEILVPRHRAGSPAAQALGLADMPAPG